MSKNTKRLLIILVLAAVFCVVGGAVAIGAVGLLGNNLKDNFAMGSDKAHAMASVNARVRIEVSKMRAV